MAKYVKHEFKAGDKVRIVDNTVDHGMDIGQVVTLEFASMFEGAYVEGLGYETSAMDLVAEGWYFDADDCVLIEESEEV